MIEFENADVALRLARRGAGTGDGGDKKAAAAAASTAALVASPVWRPLSRLQEAVAPLGVTGIRKGRSTDAVSEGFIE